MSPRVTPTEQRAAQRSSYAEYRSKPNDYIVFSDREGDVAFWKYATAKALPLEKFPGDDVSAYLPIDAERRALSKASGASGAFLVPSDFDELITGARRAANVIGALARQLETSHGRAVPIPAATAHGSGAWTAESAAVTASDETFASVTLNAYKSSTKTIVSEELAEDALEDFDRFLGDELGQRLAALEEAAFAQGDGAGKPLGLVNATNGVQAWPPLSARRPSFRSPTSALHLPHFLPPTRLTRAGSCRRAPS